MENNKFYGSVNSPELNAKTDFDPPIAYEETDNTNQTHDEKTSLLSTPSKKSHLSLRKIISIPFIWFQNLLYQYATYASFTWKDMNKRRVSFLIGISSCFVVVWMSVLCLTALDQISLVFLRLSENNQGQFDLQLSTADAVPGLSLNYYQIKDALLNKGSNASSFKNVPFENTFAPRLQPIILNFVSTKQCTVPHFDFSNTSTSTHQKWNEWMYCKEGAEYYPYCVPNYCSITSDKPYLMVLDTIKERNMGFGRDWPFDPIPKGMVVISQLLATTHNITEGDTLLLGLGSDSLLGAYRQAQIITDDKPIPMLQSYIPVTISKVVGEAYGKTSWDYQKFIVMEYEPFLSHFSYFLPPVIATEDEKIALSQVDAYQYATYMFLNHPYRFVIYNDDNYDRIQNNMVNFASLALYLIGFDQVQSSFPILEFMYRTRFFSLFLGLIINMIVTILSILSIILIYSLLMLNVENRTFEMGVLRMVGMKKIGLIQMILFQAIGSYAIPAIIIGLIIGQLSYIGVSIALSYTLQLQLSYFLTLKACFISMAIGLVIPIIASVLPIQAALSSNLHDSLDTSRPKNKAVKYSINRNSENHPSWTMVGIGLFLTVFGFGVYYFFPLSLLTYNANLLLYMFFGLLMAMLFGLVLLSLNLENICEFVITNLLLFWERQSVKSIVMKNMIAHRVRNRKTSIMFSVSMAFIIFVSIGFNLNIQTFRYQKLRDAGGRLNVMSYDPYIFHNQQFNIQLQTVLKKYDSVVTGLAYASYSLDQILASQQLSVQMTTVGHYQHAFVQVRAISPQFYRTSMSELLKIYDQYTKSTYLDELLYVKDTSNRALVATYFEEKFDLYNWNQPFVLETSAPTSQFPIMTHTLWKPLAFISSAPFTFFSKFQVLPVGNTAGKSQNIVMSFPSLVRLLQHYKPSVTIKDIPIDTAVVGLHNSVSEDSISKLKIDLQSIGLLVVDVQEQLQPIEVAVQVMNFFFLFTTCVACFLCFFSLMSSMVSNVSENAKEIGILRAIGTRKFAIIRIFIYEAFLLLIVAAFQGTWIGTVLAYTMTAQRELFTQLPISVAFPWQIVLLVFVLAIIFAFISSFFPIRSLLKQPIVSILRKL